jgi:hypothetical protein
VRAIGRLLVLLGCATGALLLAALPAIVSDHVYGDALSLVFLVSAPIGGVVGGLVVARGTPGAGRVGWPLLGLAVGFVVTFAALVAVVFAIDSATGFS